MILQRSQPDENLYILRTHKDERLQDGRMIDYCDILQGEATICLPDHNYAHADHDWAERIAYAEMLQARLPTDDYIKLMVSQWAARESVI